MRTKTVRFAFLWAVLILHLDVSLGIAQTTLTRPSISEQVSPVEEIAIQAQDGYDVIGVVRKPPGSGPFPAVVVVHGGLGTSTLSQLKNQALNNPTMTRFLAAGYVTMIPTFRSRAEDPQTLDALWDNLAIVKHVKLMAEVDPSSVVVYGCSGGGDLVLEIAGETKVAAVTAEEPASLLFTGMFNNNTPKRGANFTVPDAIPLLEDPHEVYTAELQRFTQEKIRKIRSPIFIAQGDQPLLPGVDHHKIVNEILVPELKAAGKEVEEIVYPGQRHCFGFSGGYDGGPSAINDSVAVANVAAASKFFADMNAFFKRHLNTQPVQVDDSLIEHVPVHDSYLAEGMRLARAGKISGALQAYQNAQERDARLTITASNWNGLCWYGSLWRHAAEVMAACEQAVALAPDHGGIRDSRGLARALTGDVAGAIDDFEALVAWTRNDRARAQRQDWIAALRAGENPFTPELLKRLRN